MIVGFSKMRIKFTMWDENVESDCSMLCSSPISTSTCRNTATSLSSPAGIISPHMAIRHKSPVVFSDTVLPPVLGPVTHQGVEPVAQKDIGGHHFFRVDQRMPGPQKPDAPGIVEFGAHGLHFIRQGRFGKQHIQFDGLFGTLLDAVGKSPGFFREFLQNALDFRFFLPTRARGFRCSPAPRSWVR